MLSTYYFSMCKMVMFVNHHTKLILGVSIQFFVFQIILSGKDFIRSKE